MCCIGLTAIVPDSLLSVFDENELELVMCGSSDISLEDMKEHSRWTALPAYVSFVYYNTAGSRIFQENFNFA